jgi:rhomboid protease GluP
MDDQQTAHERGSTNASVASQDEATRDSNEWFDVAFHKATGRYDSESGPTRFRGKGRIIVESSRVIFEGKPGRFGWMSKSEKFCVADSDVFNVQRLSKFVGFQLRSNSGGLYPMRVATSSPADAERLIGRLSDQQTPQFAVASAERSDFYQRLNALSPKSIAVPAIVAINIAVFIAMCLSGVSFIAPTSDSVLPWGSNFGPMTTQGQWWRLVSNMFVHFGIVHIAFNMWALYASGRTVERLFGTARFVMLYLFAGIAASMTSLLWNPGVNSAGASGAIFGVFGGMLAFVMNKRNEVPQSVMIQHRNSTVAFTIYSLFYGVAHTGIDNAAHVGGLVAGLVMGFLLARPLTAEARRSVHPANLGLACVVGLGLLLALGWPVVHPNAQTIRSRQFAALLVHLPQDENAAIAVTKATHQLATSEGWTNVRLAGAISNDICPKWDAIYNEVAAIPIQPGDRDYQLYSAMLRYFDARRKQFELIAQATLTNDAAVNAQAEEQNSLAESAISEITAARKKAH